MTLHLQSALFITFIKIYYYHIIIIESFIKCYFNFD
jgi:hypothetical protein